MPGEGDAVHQPTAVVLAVQNLSTPKELNIEGTGLKNHGWCGKKNGLDIFIYQV